MKRRSIWVIIGLMSMAIIGIGALQMYWINWSIKLSKENFEINIQDALNSVAESLAQQEQIENYAVNPAKASAQKKGLELWFKNIEDRLPSPARLQKVIDRKLSARGIYTEYKYGVFSSARNSFVIKNGNYQVDDFGPQVVAQDYTDS